MSKFSDFFNKLKKDNKKMDEKKDGALNKFSKWIMNHKTIMVIIFSVLMVLSVVGYLFVDTESDVISYLDDDTATKQGLATLQDEYNIIGDFSMGISYLPKSSVSRIVSKINLDSYISGYEDTDGIIHDGYMKNLVWIGTFDKLNLLDSIDTTETQAKLAEKFVIKTEVGEKTITTYLISIYFKTPNSSDETIACIDRIQEIVEEEIKDFQDSDKLKDSNRQVLSKDMQNADVTEFYSFNGSANNSRSLLKSSVGDMPKFVLVAVAAVFIILFLTTTSYIEPLLFLATLGISILLNMGTNIIAGQNPVGTISSITSSCATILQLAVAMDYAIFLMHTYYEELRTTPNPQLALEKALPKTIKSIVASSLTTVGGFLALFFMKFGIGYDLGFVLAKGVILSLITVVCLQPVIILFCSKLIHKTQHKWCVTPRLKFVSKIITKKGVAIPIIAVCLLLMVPAAIFQSKVDLAFITVTKEIENPTVTQIALEDSSNMLIVMAPFKYGQYDSQYEFIDKLYEVGYKEATSYKAGTEYYTKSNGEMMTKVDTVTADNFADGTYFIKDGSVNNLNDVFSLCSLFDKATLQSMDSNSAQATIYSMLHRSFISNIFVINSQGKEVINTNPDEIHYMLYTVNINGGKEDQESYETLFAIQDIANDVFGENKVQYTGNVLASYELSQVTPDDYSLVNILSVAIIFLVLLFTFKSPLKAALLVIVIETGIWINLSISYFMGDKLHFMTYLIVSAIALGATVDYAILLTSKYDEEKASGMTGQAAIRNAIYRAAPGVLTSGSIFFVACFAVQLISTNVIVQQITSLLARNAIFSMILTFTFLPAIFSVGERIKRAWSIKRGKGDPDEGKSSESIYAISSKQLKAFQEKEHIITDDQMATIADISILGDIVKDEATTPTEETSVEETKVEVSDDKKDN